VLVGAVVGRGARRSNNSGEGGVEDKHMNENNNFGQSETSSETDLSLRG